MPRLIRQQISKICAQCGVGFVTKRSEQKVCGLSCAGKSRRKPDYKPRLRAKYTVQEDPNVYEFCRKCGNAYPRTLNYFPRSQENRLGISNVCRDCVRKYGVNHRKANIAIYMEREARKRAGYRKDPVQTRKDWYSKARREALEHYGGMPPQCECCGENIYEFLAIDHIQGGGSRQKREDRCSGAALYVWLRKSGWPSGFRVLCHNCNSAYGFYGYCPHKSFLFVSLGADIKLLPRLVSEDLIQ